MALEGALKLKEISYTPTEAYSAGEMKHGPIALLDDDTPVVVVATDIHVYDKLVSNIQEVRARGAHVIAIATDGNEDIQHHADDVIYVPKTPNFLQAVLAIIPLQLLAYRSRACAGSTSTSRATWPRPSPSNSRLWAAGGPLQGPGDEHPLVRMLILRLRVKGWSSRCSWAAGGPLRLQR